MECLAEDVVFRFVSGKVPPDEVAAIDAHLAACADCRGLVADLAGDGGAGDPALDETVVAGSDATSDTSTTSPGAVDPGEAHLPAPGDVIGRYVVSRVIGMGGMGVVFLATDPTLGRRLVIKLLRAERQTSSDARRELLHEAQAMARLAHPNVVSVFDAGTYGDQVFVAMEFVEGATLRAWLEATPRSWREVLDVFLEAGRGLAAAHDVGLIHRDFKPGNVLIGKDDRVRVTDFGLARVVEHDGKNRPSTQLLAASIAAEALPATRTGAIKGTPAYMAPEQFRREPLDARTDQFAFCVALHEGLYGQRPFGQGDFDTLSRAVLAGELADLPSQGAAPPGLRSLVLRGLSVDPRGRHPSMHALLAALEDVRAREAATASSATAPTSLATARGTRGWRWMAAAALPLVVGAIGLALIPTGPRARDVRPDPATSATPSSAPPATSPASTESAATRSIPVGPPSEVMAAPAPPASGASSGAPRAAGRSAPRPRTTPLKPPTPTRYDDAPMEPPFARRK